MMSNNSSSMTGAVLPTDPSRPLRLLSLDGGGVRGLSALYILKQVMILLSYKEGTPGILRLPCEYFDLIAGTSTGGLIAVMLGPLRMDIDSCIAQYLEMAPVIFPEEGLISSNSWIKKGKAIQGQSRFKAEPMEKYIKGLIMKHLGPRATEGVDTPLDFEQNPKCKIFLCVTTANPRTHVRFRSYRVPSVSISRPSIWQACRATAAAPLIFPPISIGNPATSYVDGGIGFNNPINALLDETANLWPGRSIGCILSLGCGKRWVEDVGTKAPDLIRMALDVTTDTELRASEAQKKMFQTYGSNQQIYHRFNVENGLQKVGLEEWKQFERVSTCTSDYMELQQTQLDRCGAQLHNPQMPQTPIFTIPFAEDHDFVGRQSHLKDLCEAHKVQRRVCMSGIGGVGKTQIACKYAYEYRRDYPQSHILWIYAANRTRFLESYAEAAEGLCIAERGQDESAIPMRLCRWLGNESNGSWLMIIDGADDRDMFFRPPARDSPNHPNHVPLSAYLPPTSNTKGFVIVTTRNRKLGMDLTNQTDPIQVNPFGLDDARKLFRNKSIQQFDANFEELCAHLMFLPLAISQAAAHIRQNRSSVQEYLGALREVNPEEIEEGPLEQNLGDGQRDSRAVNAVFATWQMSYEAVSIEDEVAARFVSLMAVFDKQQIPFSLLSRDPKPSNREKRAFETLGAFSLITILADENAFSIHNLVQKSVQRWLHHSKSFRISKLEGLAVMAVKFPFYESENFKQCNLLERHAIAVLKLGGKEKKNKDYGQVLLNLASYESHIGRYSEAHDRNTQAFKILEEHEPSGLLVLKGILNAGFTLSQTKRLPEAEQVLRRAVSRSVSAFPDSSMVFEAQETLAEILLIRGKYNEALSIHTDVYNQNLRMFGLDGLETFSSERELARILTKLGKFEDAEARAKRSYEGRKSRLGIDHADTLSSGNQLAIIFQHQIRTKEALEIHQTILRSRRGMLGEEHPLTLTTIHNIGAVYHSLRNFTGAAKIAKYVHERREKILGAEHMDTLTSLNEIATAEARLQNYDTALQSYRSCHNGRTQLLGPDHELTFGTQLNIVRVLCAYDKIQLATLECQGLYEKHMRVLGEDHPQTRLCLETSRQLQADPPQPINDQAKPSSLWNTRLDRPVLSLIHNFWKWILEHSQRYLGPSQGCGAVPDSRLLTWSCCGNVFSAVFDTLDATETTDLKDLISKVESRSKSTTPYGTSSIISRNFLQILMQQRGAWYKHEEVEITDFQNDKELFDVIRRVAQNTRTPSFMPRRIKDVKSVRFVMSQRKVDAISKEHRPHEDKPCHPTIEEILIKNTYSGPIFGFPSIPVVAWLHGLGRCRQSETEAFWLSRIPVKLERPMLATSEAQVGWGLLIVDGYDLRVLIPMGFLLMSFLLLLDPKVSLGTVAGAGILGVLLVSKEILEIRHTNTNSVNI